MKRAVAHHLAAREVLETREEPLFMMGHSLGGLITAASVAYRPEGVSGAVLSAPALKIELNPALKAIAGFLASIVPNRRRAEPGRRRFRVHHRIVAIFFNHRRIT